MNNTSLVAIALGSNLGDRDAHVDFAVARLASLLTDVRMSSRYDTAPVDVIGEQPTFLNAAIVGRTRVPPHDLLRELQQIEAARGRERPYVNAPRTLDLDLVLYGSLVMEDDLLVLPHPRFRERVFVLEPLAEIAPELVDPVTGLSMAALLSRVQPGSPAPGR